MVLEKRIYPSCHPLYCFHNVVKLGAGHNTCLVWPLASNMKIKQSLSLWRIVSLICFSHSHPTFSWTLTVLSSCVILAWPDHSTKSKRTVGIQRWQSMWRRDGTELLRSYWDPQGISCDEHLSSVSAACVHSLQQLIQQSWKKPYIFIQGREVLFIQQWNTWLWLYKAVTRHISSKGTQRVWTCGALAASWERCCWEKPFSLGHPPSTK